MLRYRRSKYLKKEPLLKKIEEKSIVKKFWDAWGETINGLFGLLIFIAVIAVVIFAFVSCGKAVENDYDRTHDSFQQVYEPSGIFSNHPLEALGPNEIVGSELHGTFFSVLIVSSGNVDGKTTETLNLRFKWQDPSKAFKVKEYPYEHINFRISPEYSSPQLKLNFTKTQLEQQLRLFEDLTVYDYNNFFSYTVTIDVFMNQATYDIEMKKLELK